MAAVSGTFRNYRSKKWKAAGKPDIHIPTIKYLDVFGQVPLQTTQSSQLFLRWHQLKTQLHQAPFQLLSLLVSDGNLRGAPIKLRPHLLIDG